MPAKPSANTIAEQWLAFEKLVLDPIDAPPIQRRETRRAFYAGFAAALTVAIAIGDDEISEDASVAMLEGLHQECNLFAASIARGDA